MTIQDIERLIGTALTADDRKAIREECEAAGLNVRFNGNCPNCYQDALHLLRHHYTAEKASNEPVEGRKWLFVGNHPVMWNGRVRMDAFTPDEVVDEFVKFHPKYYRRNDTAQR